MICDPPTPETHLMTQPIHHLRLFTRHMDTSLTFAVRLTTLGIQPREERSAGTGSRRAAGTLAFDRGLTTDERRRAKLTTPAAGFFTCRLPAPLRRTKRGERINSASVSSSRLRARS